MWLTNTRYFKLLAYCLILPFNVFCQKNIKILDLERKTPIPFASVYCKQKQIGMYANEHGEFTISNNLQSTDTLLISNVAYHPISLIIKNIKSEIYLESRINSLNNVFVTPKGIELVLGAKKKDSHFVEVLNKPQLRNEIALLINNNKNYEAKIMSISVFFNPSGKPNTPFKIRVYSSKNEKPYNDILLNDLVISGNKKGGWQEINLEPYSITFDGEGVFVGVESIYGIKKSSFYMVTNMSTGIKEVKYGQSLGLTDEFNTATAYQRQFGDIWTPFQVKFPNFYSTATFYPMIKIKIKLDE